MDDIEKLEPEIIDVELSAETTATETPVEESTLSEDIVNLFKGMKSPAQKRAEKLEKWKQQYSEMSDGNYKKAQLAGKIYFLNQKVNPSISWDTKADGTLILTPEQKDAKLKKSTKRQKHRGV